MGIPAGTLKPKVKKIPSGARATSVGGAIGLLRKLGPGLVTGASDDDPSGIATYSQVGAQFGYGLLWTMVLTYPLMAAIQEISARIGRVTGSGIAADLRKSYPKPILYLGGTRPNRHARQELTPARATDSWAPLLHQPRFPAKTARSCLPSVYSDAPNWFVMTGNRAIWLHFLGAFRQARWIFHEMAPQTKLRCLSATTVPMKSTRSTGSFRDHGSWRPFSNV
jgi:natural resistance-associated macrophage protein